MSDRHTLTLKLVAYMQSTLNKHFLAWRAARNAVRLLEDDIIDADAAAADAEDKRQSFVQVTAQCVPETLVHRVGSCTVPC